MKDTLNTADPWNSKKTSNHKNYSSCNGNCTGKLKEAKMSKWARINMAHEIRMYIVQIGIPAITAGIAIDKIHPEWKYAIKDKFTKPFKKKQKLRIVK